MKEATLRTPLTPELFDALMSLHTMRGAHCNRIRFHRYSGLLMCPKLSKVRRATRWEMASVLLLIDLWQAVLLKPFTKVSMRPVADKLLNSDNLIDSLAIESISDLVESPHDLCAKLASIFVAKAQVIVPSLRQHLETQCRSPIFRLPP